MTADILPFSRPATAAAEAVDVPPLVVDARRLAAMLNKSIRTVRVWDARGLIPTPLRIGGSVVWRVDEIRDWLDAGAPDRVRWSAIRASRK